MHANPQVRAHQGLLSGAAGQLAASASSIAIKAPEITNQVEGLRAELGRLGVAVSELTGRLAPVRRIPVPAALGSGAGNAAEGPAIRVPQTPLGTQLDELRRELMAHISTVEGALFDLELP